MAKVYIEKERVAHILTTNKTGARIEKNQFVVFGSFVGVADNDSEPNTELSLHIERGIEIQVDGADLSEIDAAIGAPLYYDVDADKFTITASGNTLVGTVSANEIASGGVLRFAKV